MSYNLTGIADNTSGLLSFTQAVNNNLMRTPGVSDGIGWLGILFLISVTIISFSGFMFSTNEVKKSLASSAFICLGFSMLLGAMSMVPVMAIIISFVFSGIAIAFTFKT